MKNWAASLKQFGQRVWRGRLTRSALISLIQPLTGMVCLFGSYRILTDKVGIEGVGLWSLLVAGSLVARLADVSGSGGLARFVAIERAKPVGGAPVDYIHTMTLATLAFNVTAAVLFWLASGWLIERFVEPRLANDARMIAPLAILSIVCLAPVATTLCSAIDGTQRSDQRAILISVSSVFLFGFTWWLVPEYGGVGFAAAQLIQQIVVILGAWGVLRQNIHGLGFLPHIWRASIFKEIIGFGVLLQATALASLLTEPTAKLMLNHWGGLALVGYYEFALRLLLQLRGLLVVAAQPILAAAAGLSGQADQLVQLLERSTRVAIVAGLGLTVCAVAIAPVYSLLMLGRVQNELIVMVGALAFAFGVNAISIPFSFAATGLGVMRWNLVAQIQAAATILLLGIPLGRGFGGAGVVASLVVAIVTACVVTLIGNARSLDVSPVIARALPGMLLGVVVMMIVSIAGVQFVLRLN